MAIAFIRGTLTRDPYFTKGDSTSFTAFTIKETYTKNGEEQLGGYHDVVAFDSLAQELAALNQGDRVELKTSIRYRADKRFVSTKDKEKNPFMAQFVVMELLSKETNSSDDDDPFADA